MAERTLSLADAVSGFDCKTPDCKREARTNRGQHAYLCDECIRDRGARALPGGLHESRARQTPLAPPARDLAKAAAAVDLARERFVKHAQRLDEQVRKLQETHAEQGQALKAAVVKAERDYLRAAASMGLGPIREQP